MTPYQLWRDRFAAALDGNLYGIDYLDYLVLGVGLAHVWPGVNAAIVTEFKYFPGPSGHDPNVKAIHGLVAAGDISEIKRLIKAAEVWGKGLGCRFAMISSRPGWQRALKDEGYEPHQITIVKEL